jgi:integrase
MARPLQQRFEKSVDRRGEHHLWTGAKRPGLGTGRMRIDGKEMPAHRIAWELAHGPLGAGGSVFPCPDEPACVRLEHLTVDAPNAAPRSPKKRGRKGGGSMREVRAGVWEFSVMNNPSSDRRPERLYRRVEVPSAAAAARELATFVEEVRIGGPPPAKDLRGITLNEAIGMFLDEHLAAEKGREHRTLADYRQLHDRWFAPELGLRPVRDIDEAQIDRAFGKMRAAGLSRSRLNHAKSLYRPFFRWAKSRRIIPRNPMLEFQLPTSTYVSKERTPPEVEELSMLLAQAVALTPEVAPVLVLGAVTGMRRGELVGLQRSRIRWAERRIVVNAAMDGKRVKATKTRMERSFFVDEATIGMLRRHCEHIDDLAAEVGAVPAPDPFVFTLSIDGSEPMPAHYLTKRVAVLKEHLGIEEKKPETIAREDEALRLFRQPPAPRQPGVAGPTPKGGMPLREIGALLGRSERWAALAVASAERREAAGRQGLSLDFDGSILALRKFTSSELLDAGFNISMVSQRQGHGPQVLVNHYSKSRRSADRKAAEHLGRLVHQAPQE